MHPRRTHLIRLLSLCIIFGVFAPLLLLPSHVQAVSHAIRIIEISHKIDFPNSIEFQVSAGSTGGSIADASIHVKYGDNKSFLMEGTADGIAGSPVNRLSWKKDLSKDFVPVGTAISYYWTVRDSSGQSQKSETKSFIMTDSRFNWQQIKQGYVQLNWYQGSQAFGQMVLKSVNNGLERIKNNTGVVLNRPVNVWIYENTDDFQSSLPPETREWVGGIAFPELNTTSFVVEDEQDYTLRRDLPHEMSHLVLHQQFKVYIPLWFDEGMAVYNQEYREPRVQLTFDDAKENQKLFRFKDIANRFPDDSEEASLAYAQSWQIIDYMYKTYGKSKMMALLKNLENRTQIFSETMKETLGVDIPRLEHDWRIANNQSGTLKPEELTPTVVATPTPKPQGKQPQETTPSTNTPVLVGTGILLVSVPVLTLIIAGIVIARRRREQEQAVQQAQAIVNHNFPAHYGPYAQGPHAWPQQPHTPQLVDPNEQTMPNTPFPQGGPYYPPQYPQQQYPGQPQYPVHQPQHAPYPPPGQQGRMWPRAPQE